MVKQTETATASSWLVKVNDYQPIAEQDKLIRTLDRLKENLPGGELGVFDLTVLKLPSGKATDFEIDRLGGLERIPAVEGVILKAISGRSYWSIPFTQSGGGMNTDCQSADGITGIGDPGGDCLTCRYGRYGEERNECKVITFALMAVKGALMPWVIRVPPGSQAKWRKYLFDLSEQLDVDPTQVVTRCTLKTTSSKGRTVINGVGKKEREGAGIDYPEIQFELVGILDEAAQTQCDRLRQCIEQAFGGRRQPVTVDPQTRDDELKAAAPVS